MTTLQQPKTKSDPAPKPVKKHLFKKGDPRPEGSGRKKGQKNTLTLKLKDAILTAAERLGSDRRGKDGLTGYLMNLAVTEPRVYARLLEKLLPYQLTGRDGGPLQVEQYGSREELEAAFKERGLPVPPPLGLH